MESINNINNFKIEVDFETVGKLLHSELKKSQVFSLFICL